MQSISCFSAVGNDAEMNIHKSTTPKTDSSLRKIMLTVNIIIHHTLQQTRDHRKSSLLRQLSRNIGHHLDNNIKNSYNESDRTFNDFAILQTSNSS